MKLKRVLSYILIIALILPVIPAFPITAGAETTTGTTGNCIWTLNGTELTISGTGTMEDYAIEWEGYIPTAPWGTAITKVTIEDGVTSIGAWSFTRCNLLTEIILPDSVTSIGYAAFGGCSSIKKARLPSNIPFINDAMFYGCRSLTEITLPEGISNIGSDSFNGCTSLKKINIPNTVTEISACAFYGCSALTEISLPDSITTLGYNAFQNCSSLTKINIPSGVTDIYPFVFQGCSALKEIVIPEGVTWIETEAFKDCVSLEKITLPSTLTNIDQNAFSGCKALKEVWYGGLIPDRADVLITAGNEKLLAATWHYDDCGDHVYDNTCDDSCNLCAYVRAVVDHVYDDGCDEACNVCNRVRNDAHSFEWVVDKINNCGVDGFKHEKCTDCFATRNENTVIPATGDHRFGDAFDAPCEVCGMLRAWGTTGDCEWVIYGTELTIRGTGAMEDYAIEWEGHYISAAPWGTEITKVIIEEGVTYIGSAAFIGCTQLTEITIPDSVVGIGTSAFEYCYKLKEIDLPDELLYIDPYAFCTCVALEEIIIPDKVDHIADGLFQECTSLRKVTIPDSVVRIGEAAFIGCEALEWINIPKSVKSIGMRAFGECNSLKVIYIPDGTTTIDVGTFIGCDALTKVYLPNSITSIGPSAFEDCRGLREITLPEGITSIGDSAFCMCTSLTNINIPSSVKSIGAYVFAGCQSLTEVSIPNGVTSIGDTAFGGCSMLKTVNIPRSVTSISEGLFASCYWLKEINIPNGVKSIGARAFEYCQLTDVWYLGTAEDWSKISIDASNTELAGATIHYCTITNSEIICLGGTEEYTCSDCGRKKVITISGLGHAYSSTVIPATDREFGYTKFTCSRCGDIYKINRTYPTVSISGSCGWDVVWAFNEETGLLTIDGTGDMDTYTDVNAPWYSLRSRIYAVEIRSGITSIGTNAFAGCNKLVEIKNDSAIQLELGSDANGGIAKNAKNIYSSKEGQSQLTYQGDFVFITIGKAGYLVDYRGYAAVLELPEEYSAYNGSTVEFYSLLEESVSRNSIISKVVLPNSVTGIGNTTFAGSTSITDFFIYNYSCEIFDDALTLLNEATIHGYIGSTADSYAQTYGNSFMSVTEEFPYGVCGDAVTWSVNPDSGVLSLSGSGDMYDYEAGAAPWYAYQDEITSVSVDPRITRIGSYAFYMLRLVTYIDCGYSVQSIGTYAFAGCFRLKSFKLPETVTEIAEGAFDNCVALKIVEIPEQITAIGKEAFRNCEGLVQVNIGNNVTAIGDNAFSGCSSLTQIYFRGEPAALGENALGATSGKFVYYYSTISGWDEAISDGKWNGYMAIPYNAIVKENFDGTNVCVFKVVDRHNNPLVNALVNYGGKAQSTNKDGMAYFVKSSDAQALEVFCSDHITFIDNAFRTSATQVVNVIELSDSPSVVQGVRVNGESIATSVVTINCNKVEAVNILVSGYSKYTILKYELYQGNRLISTRETGEETCTFLLPSASFEEEETVFVKMYTSDGSVVASALNIDIIYLGEISPTQILKELGDMELSFALGGLGNYKIPMTFTPSKDETFYTIIKDRTIRIGINLDIGEFFEKGEKDAPKGAIHKMVDQAMKKYGKDKSKYEYNVCGYIEIEYLGNRQYYIKTCYVKAGVTAKLAFEAQASYFGVVGVYFRATWAGETAVDVKVTRYEPVSGFGLEDLNFSLEHDFKLEGGAYLLWGAGSAGLYAQLKMGFVIGVVPFNGIESVYITGKAGVKWSVLWGLWSGDHVFIQGDIYRWPEAQSYSLRRLSSNLYVLQRDPSSYELNDRAYLEDRSEWLGGEYLQKNIYGNVAPKIVACGDTVMMLWLDDNSQRDDANFQTLYYSVYENGTWSEPMVVADNGTFDCEFDVYTDGEKIYVVYTEMTGSNQNIAAIDLESESDMAAFISGVEVSVITFEDGHFGEAVRLTDNENCEILPRVTAVDGEVTVVWAQTDFIGIDGETTNSAICSATLGQSGWRAPVEQVSGQNTVSGVVSVMLSGEGYTAYIVDADGSGETKDDQVLVLCDKLGYAAELDKGMISGVSTANVGGKAALTWYNDGKIYMITAADAKPVCLSPENSSVGANYQIVTVSEELTLLTVVMNNNESDTGTDIYSVYIDATGCLSNPVRLTETDGIVENYAAVYEDGMLIITFTETFADVEGENVETVTDFRSAQIPFFTDIALEQVDFDLTQVEKNAELNITVSVSNRGTNSVEGFVVKFYDPYGQLLYTVDYDAVLQSGASNMYELTIILPQTILTAGYRLEVLPKIGSVAVDDADDTDNSAEMNLAYADLGVAAEQIIVGEKNYLMLTVSNTGNVASKAVIEVYAPDELGRKLTDLETGLIAPGAAEQYMVELDVLTTAADKCVTCLIIAAAEDPYQLDNKETVPLLHINEDVFTVDPEEIVHNPEISMSAADFDKYTPQDITFNITAEAESFAGVEGLVQGVDFTVVDSTVTIKEAYLLDLQVGVHTLKIVFDFGYDAPVVRTMVITVADSTPVALGGTVEISGGAWLGSTVYANIAGLKPMTANVTYCWTVDGVIVSTTNSYVIAVDDYGKTLTLTVCGTDGYVGEKVDSAEITKLTPIAPSFPVVSEVGMDFIAVVKTKGVEYSLDGVTWQDEPVFTGLQPNTAYNIYARKKATETFYASHGCQITVRTANVPAISGKIGIVGEPECGQTLTIDFTAFVGDVNSITCQWYCDGAEIYGATGTTYTVAKAYAGKTISVRVTGVRDYCGELVAAVEIRTYVLGDVDGDLAVTIRDATTLRRFVANWEGVTVNEETADVNGDGIVNIRDATILRRHVAQWEGYENLYAV